jgi:hypothetical protein
MQGVLGIQQIKNILAIKTLATGIKQSTDFLRRNFT